MQQLINSTTVARMLGVSRVTVWRLARAGKLNPVRLSARIVRYRLTEVEALIQSGAARMAPTEAMDG